MRVFNVIAAAFVGMFLTGCAIEGPPAKSHVICGPGTYAVRGDGNEGKVQMDGSGRWVDQDGNVMTEATGGVLCQPLTPPTACGPGTLRVDAPWGMAIEPDGSGWFVEQDGSGRWVEQDKGAPPIPAFRACLMGEPAPAS